MQNPLVSFVMPVHNGEAYLKKAVDSIFGQTCSNFEIIAVDDGSTDSSLSILKSYRDSRLRVLHNPENAGVAKSLNKGLKASRGTLIARMDADDISLAQRLAVQLDFLKSHPDVGLCGAWIKRFGSGYPYHVAYPVGHETCKAYMLFSNPLAHSTVILRKSMLKENKLSYCETIQAAQDIELWQRCSEYTKIDNIPKILVNYRSHKKSVTSKYRKASLEQLLKVLERGLSKLKLCVNRERIGFHAEVGNGSGMYRRSEIVRASEWLRLIYMTNNDRNVYDAKGLGQAIGFVWFRLCRNSAHLGPWILRAYKSFPFCTLYQPPKSHYLIFLLSIFRGIAGQLKSPQGRLSVRETLDAA